MSMPQNYMANVKCPHCSAPLVAALSGFGGHLSTRVKQCKKCNAEFYIHLLVETSVNETVSDVELCALRSSIDWIKKERKRTKAELLLRYEQARKLLDEAMTEARQMREKAEAN